MHVTGDSRKEINKTLKKVYETLDIRDEDGNNMVLEEFSFPED
jgi:hypothetical protein